MSVIMNGLRSSVPSPAESHRLRAMLRGGA